MTTIIKVKRNKKVFTVKEYMEVMKEGDYVETNINAGRLLDEGNIKQGVVSLSPKCRHSPDSGEALGILLDIQLGEKYSVTAVSFPYCYNVWWVGLNTEGYIKLLGNKKDANKYKLDKDNKISLSEGSRLVVEGDKIKIEGRYFGLVKPLEGEATMLGYESFILLQDIKGGSSLSEKQLKGYKKGTRVSFFTDYYFEFI